VIDFDFPSFPIPLGVQHHVRRKARLRDSTRSRRRTNKRSEDEDGYSPKSDNGRTPVRRLVNLSAIGSSLILLFKKIRQNESVLRTFRFGAKHKRISIPLLLLLFFFIQVHYNKIFQDYNYNTMFGSHPIPGGYFGRTIDRMFMRMAMEKHFGKQENALKELGLYIPSPELDPMNVLCLRTHAAERELLVRRELRARALISLTNAAEDYPKGCSRDKTLFPSFLVESENSSKCGVLRVLFVPNLITWHRQRPGHVTDYTVLLFDESEMRDLVEDVAPTLLKTFDLMSTLDDKIQLWALCAVYYHGGIFIGDRLAIQQQSVEELLLDRDGILSPVDHSAPVAVVKFEKLSNSAKQISMIAATPRHPHLRCVLSQLEREKSIDAAQILETFFLPRPKQGPQPLEPGQWNQITTHCGYETFSAETCCVPGNMVALENIPKGRELVRSISGTDGELVSSISATDGYIFLQLMDAKSDDGLASYVGSTATVGIVQEQSVKLPVKSRKVTLESRMQKKRVEPGWLCTRCIRSPLFGSLDKCGSVCPSGYGDLMCHAPDVPEKTEIPVHVTVTNGSSQKLIPRIIHQTYFEDMTLDRYPELVRLQNSWKNSGWEYRFYNDITAKQYILKNFPQRFADAFDALIPGAYKADLFRYLILMKEGGVYADVDIMLETTLDTFITPSMSFFAPRDVVGEYAGEPFCLWNGLIGAAPGHPFIVRAVERLVSLILERSDLYDMERDICRLADEPAETWKIRAEPLLLFSGPCALGVAANEVLNRSSLASFDTGWLGLDSLNYGGKQDHGDALILVGDKFDTGAFRISDPERNFVVASTELPGLVKTARSSPNPTEGEKRRRVLRKKPLPHYSSFASDTFVWGSRNIYKDNLVTNERIKFHVCYDDAKRKRVCIV
jgi:mannosyltransferase OCH1-like enzyme